MSIKTLRALALATLFAVPLSWANYGTQFGILSADTNDDAIAICNSGRAAIKVGRTGAVDYGGGTVTIQVLSHDLNYDDIPGTESWTTGQQGTFVKMGGARTFSVKLTGATAPSLYWEISCES